MDGLETSANYLITLSESVGPVGAFFIFMGIIILIIGLQASYYYFRKRSFGNLIEKEVKKVLNKIDDNEEDITVILDILRNIAQAILSINKKIKYTLSDRDAVSVVKLVTTGNLLLSVFTQSMLFSIDIKDRPEEIVELRNQFILELENKWMEYVDNLNLFRAAVRIGDCINERFRFVFLNDNVVEGELGLAFKIREIVFNPHIIYGMKYSRINTLFSNFSQELIHTLEEELTKIMNGGNRNGIS
jgi:hypothetical protein